jgi:2-iminobutanoate/2-iminopropanoate deaminase
MFRVSSLAAAIILNFFMDASAGAQTLKVERYNYAEWTKGRLTEVVTVTGPGKMIFLAGVGAEDEDKSQGAIRHLGNLRTFSANAPTIK